MNGPQPIDGEIRRVDAFDKVTDRTRYGEDILIPDLLHARVLRSPFHHARLLALDTSQAVQVSGIIRIITAEDIPGVNGFPEYSHDEPLLTPVGDTLKTKGAPIALVVADSLKAAQAGVDAIRVEYEQLPHFFDASKSDRPIYADRDCLNEHRVSQGDVQAAFSASETLLETRYTTSYQEHAALERESALGYLDEAGRVTVLGGTHEPHWQRNWIAETLGLPPDRVRFITPPTGGSFGGKQDPWPLIATGSMTYLTQRPVQRAYSRAESLRITLADLAGEFDQMGKSRRVPGFFDPSPIFPEANRPTYTPH